MSLSENMPPDPFKAGIPDLSEFAANCRGMYTSLVAAGFKEVEALEITIRFLTAAFMKAIP